MKLPQGGRQVDILCDDFGRPLQIPDPTQPSQAQSKDAEDAKRWRFCLKYNFPSNTPIEELDEAIAAEGKA